LLYCRSEHASVLSLAAFNVPQVALPFSSKKRVLWYERGGTHEHSSSKRSSSSSSTTTPAAQHTMAPVKVAINGCGRIGRLAFRAAFDQADKFDFCASE
jgi:hypothetical protein